MNESIADSNYYVLLIAGFFALLLPLLSLAINQYFQNSQGKRVNAPLQTPTVKPEQRKENARINVRYFSGMALSLLLVTMALVMLPLSASVPALLKEHESFPYLIFSYFLIMVSIILGILYANNKGDLTWLKSFREEKDERD